MGCEEGRRQDRNEICEVSRKESEVQAGADAVAPHSPCAEAHGHTADGCRDAAYTEENVSGDRWLAHNEDHHRE